MQIDILFLIFMALAVFKGFTKGLIIGIFSFIAYFVGLAAALKLSSTVAHHIAGKDQQPSFWLPVISFLLVFIVVVLVVNLVARIIKRMVQATMLGLADRIDGIVFFVLIYIFIFSILVFYAVELKVFNKPAIESSKVYPYIAPVAPFMINLLSKILPVFKNIFDDLQMFFENLKQHY